MKLEKGVKAENADAQVGDHEGKEKPFAFSFCIHGRTSPDCLFDDKTMRIDFRFHIAETSLFSRIAFLDKDVQKNKSYHIENSRNQK